MDISSTMIVRRSPWKHFLGVLLFVLPLIAGMLFIGWWMRYSAALLMVGHTALLYDDTEKALDAYDRAGFLSLGSASREARAASGLLLLFEGRCAEARTFLEPLVLRTDHPMIRVLLGESLVCEEQYSEARESFMILLGDYSYSSYALEQLAMIAFREGEWERANTLFAEAASLDSLSERGMYYHALLVLRERSLDAPYLFQSVVDGGTTEYARRSAFLLSGLHALASFEGDANYRAVALADRLSLVGEQMFALELLDGVLEQEEDYRDAYLVRAQVFVRLQRFPEAEQDLNEVLRLDPEEYEQFREVILSSR